MTPRSTNARRGPRGSVMVQALIVLAGLVALLATLAANQRAALDSIQNDLRDRRAEMAGQSAAARALAVLQAANANLVTATDDWAQLGNGGSTVFDLGGATFRLQIIDAGSLINVNTASEQQLTALPLVAQQVDSLLDWRSAGTTPRANGAKDEYYNALDKPYNTKLGPLTTVSELLLIQGWTASGLLAPQTTTVSTAPPLQDVSGNPLPLIDVLTVDSGAPNTQASGTARINVGQGRLTAATFNRAGVQGNVATQLATGGPYTTFQALLGRPGVTTAVAQSLLQSVTVTTGTRLQGKINLNTATQSVLTSVPNVTPDIATAIIAQQATGFSTLGDLTKIAGLTGTRLAQVADAFAVGSDTWIVRAYGESGGVGHAYEGVLGIRAGNARVLSWTKLPNAEVPVWWNWTDQPDAPVDAGSGQTTAQSSVSTANPRVTGAGQ